MVKPVVYGSETWPMSDMDIKRLNTRKRKILGRLHGPVVEQVIWRIRTNWGENLYKDLDVVADIKKKRLECIGQLARMDHGRVVKKFFAF
jgi:sigma54-dependent transcription regulator